MKSAYIIFSLLAFLAPSPLAAQDGNNVEIVSVSKSPDLASSLARRGFDLLADAGDRLYLAVPVGDLSSFEKLGLPFRVETRTFPPALPSTASALSGPIGAFHTHRELEADLFALEARFPGRAKILRIGESLEGRPLYALKVSDNPGLDENEPALFVLGCHHAREWISVEVPYLFGRHLLEHYETDPEVRRIVDEAETWIVPMVNPDGHDYSVRVHRYWRKNRRDNGDGTFGVDLNRNYGLSWGIDNAGSSPDGASNVYRGTGPFSEPEARAVRDLVLGRRGGALVSYHSYAQLILYPWGYTRDVPPEAVEMDGIARRMSEAMFEAGGRTYLFGQAGRSLYLTNGDTTDWSFGAAGIPSFTVELPPIDALGGGFFNGEEDIVPLFLENLPALLHLGTLVVGQGPFEAKPPPDLRDLLQLRPKPGIIRNAGPPPIRTPDRPGEGP